MTPPTNLYERVLMKYGLSTAIAVFLIWKMTTGISGHIDQIQTALNEHITETAYYLRAICVNTAQDDIQRAACMMPRSH